ncbi:MULTISPECIES: RbsD/FucU domain-containing protein [Oceanithermus]|uniref:Fucose isomerase n=2 Tax=Oceanithermus desulfurans TaxID=227924 RepID=A0A511RH68_9DEIN|nr:MULTISPECIES: RbsD/FucU domain-containing protein [Oceanithermus]MBB6028936.1 L-fucose mutarotase [Oceanithermus desulfurans]GEM88993.1 fucose isomerase [Oceanithermus desulfurans NBRC 100063]
MSMLKGVSPLLSPELLAVLAEMGHGDEIAIVDGNYPAHSSGPPVIRADGLGTPELVEAVLELMPLDTFSDANVWYMDNGEAEKPEIWKAFDAVLAGSGEDARVEAIDRFAYYERAREAYAIVATSETRLYACIILKKGVIFPV